MWGVIALIVVFVVLVAVALLAGKGPPTNGPSSGPGSGDQNWAGG